jgi:hypothetical protein
MPSGAEHGDLLFVGEAEFAGRTDTFDLHGKIPRNLLLLQW